MILNLLSYSLLIKEWKDSMQHYRKDNHYENSFAALFSVASRHAFETYWLPRSEWIISGKTVLRQAFALLIVSTTVDTSIVSARVQSMTFSGIQVHNAVKVYKTILRLDISYICAPDSARMFWIKLFVENVLEFHVKI